MNNVWDVLCLGYNMINVRNNVVIYDKLFFEIL
jgi:hypothetical protein